MFKKSSKKFSKLKVKFNSHCEDERSEDAAIQTKSTGAPRAKVFSINKKTNHHLMPYEKTLSTTDIGD